jgi:bifunctional non-homologous end joining protein LigD
MSLKEYQAKRNFTKTREPKGATKPAAKPRANAASTAEEKTSTRHRTHKPRFVVHKHDASRLHYDLRLEMEGVLKSWAVPKGPSLNPRDKHLAVMVEDHPFEYRNFEGTIAEGEYGAGTVMIWDEGTYQVVGDHSGPEGLERGALKIALAGKKLKGGWMLVRTKWQGHGKNWLLIKERDEYARSRGDVLKDEPRSARSGRTMEQIATQEGKA